MWLIKITINAKPLKKSSSIFLVCCNGSGNPIKVLLFDKNDYFDEVFQIDQITEATMEVF